MRTQDRLLKKLSAASDDYPDAWRTAEAFRQGKGKDGLPDWPEWCYCPMGGWSEIIRNDLQVDNVNLIYNTDIARLAALGAWRYTQSIYRINEDLFQGLIETAPKGNLPVSVLMRIPEWCVYIETPGLKHNDVELHGFFAHLEWNTKTESAELRLLLDKANGFYVFILHMGNWTIMEASGKAVQKSREIALSKGEHELASLLSDEYIATQTVQIYPLISLLLYVCSDGVEYRASNKPANPQPKRTRRYGWKLFPAAHPRVWNLGDKTGEQLKRNVAEWERSTEHKGVRPHMRRAHWHTFYAGPRDQDREVRVKWIVQLMIAGGDDDDSTE